MEQRVKPAKAEQIVLEGEAAPASPGRLHKLMSVEHIRVL